MEKIYDAIIIGTGAGALSCGVCLAKAGQKVLMLEQHDVPGGWCHSFMLKGQRFSPGVHYVGLLGEGEGTSELYRQLGVANDMVFFKMKKEGYEHCWIGDQQFHLPVGFENLKKYLSDLFPKEKENIHTYLDLVKTVNTELQLVPKLQGFWAHLTIPYRTKHMGKYGLFSLKRVIDWHIKDPMLKTLLNIQCGDHGLPPARASFLVHCVLMSHYFEGGYYPLGGGGGIVKAFTKRLKSLGTTIKTQAKVTKILTENNTAYGVQTEDGTIYKAKNIISNADPNITFLDLVGKENISNKLNKRLANTKYSVTSLILFLTVDMDVTKHGLDSGNIWKTKTVDLDAVFGKLTKEKINEGKEFGGVFISCTTLKDPASFNGRYHNFEVVTFLDNSSFDDFEGNADYHSEAYTKFKNQLREKMINSLEEVLPGVRNHIVQAELGTPMTNRYYINTTKGSVYGTEKTLRGVGPFAYKARTEIANLYLCGASTLSHGVGGATHSGVEAASKILGIRSQELLVDDPSQTLRVYDAEDADNWPDWVHEKRAIRKRRFTTAEESSNS